MPDDTTILSLPLILPAQAQKHVTHNEALVALDLVVQLAVISRVLATPPALPTVGDRYIVAAAPTGPWAGQAGRIALYAETGWQFTAALPGWCAHVLAEKQMAAFDGLVWKTLSDLPLTVPQLGVAATADATNRLTVSAPATLLNHAGSGHQLKLNKAAPADTASLLFQTGFSGRAEMGTAGDSDFSVKVSADGSVWFAALKAEAATGEVTLPRPLRLGGQATDPASPANGMLWLNTTTGEVRLRAGGVTVPLGGGISDGDKGDVTVSGGGTVWTVDAGAISLGKLAGMATASLLGRDTAGTGAPEVLSPALVRGILNVANGATANATDAALRDRALHTGTQAATTITGLAVVATSGSATDLGAGTLPAARFNDAAHGTRAGGTLHPDATTSVSGFLSGADKTKLNGIATGATANAADAALRDRATHTGTQLATTISDFADASRIAAGFASTATAGGTTTLTAASGDVQIFTGTLAQTVVLPVASTLALGRTFRVKNESTGNVTVQSSGLNAIGSVLNEGQDAIFTCVLTSGTGVASWVARIEGGRLRTGSGALVFAGNPAIAGPSFTGVSLFPAGSTSGPSLRLPHGVAPTTPTDGDIWSTTTGVFARLNGATVDLAATGGGGVSDGDKGDITVSGGGVTWSIDTGAVALAKLADVATARIFGRATAGTGVPEALTGAQATTLLDTFTAGLKGLVPASGGGTTTFLRADGSFAAPAGGSATDLTYTPATRLLESSTGADVVLPLVSTTAAGLAERPEAGPSRFYAFNDLHRANGDINWQIDQSGTGASVAARSDLADGGFGWCNFNLGTVATNRCSILAGPGALRFGLGAARFAARVRQLTLSDATNTHSQRVGFLDAFSAESTDGVFFRYTDAVNGGKWQAVTRSNNTETAVDTGITAAINTTYRFEILVNAAGSSAEFRIDGAVVATVTTNIPTAAGRETGAGILLMRTVGTASVTPVSADYVLVDQVMTTAR